MKTIQPIAEMQAAALEARRKGLRIGLVPTMGFLHEGHLSLMRRARSASDVVVVSVFVNPSQFAPGEDYAAYPRDPARDAALCRDEGVDVLFCPAAGRMYPAGHSVYVDEGQLAAGLCGASRPGHFRGVMTVVAKLFNIVRPQVAVFGQKDAQQARIIEQMVADLNFPIEIVVAPTVRASDGLALSSRNAYLSPEERQRATCLCRALCLAEKMYGEGERSASVIREAMRFLIEGAPGDRIEYVEVVDYAALKPLETIRGPALIALCVRIGKTRLIDNAIVGKTPPVTAAVP